MAAMRRLSLALSLALLALVPGAAGAATCTGNPSEVKRLDLTVGGQPTYGLYTLPAGAPRGMVVFAHGYSYNVDAWREHMVRAATKDGLVAVTMDYRGLKDLPKDATGFERARGWPVKAGSEDLVAAGQYFDRVCGGFDRRFMLGVSMGGNSSGMAAALKAKTLDGRPLFDYWVGIEGVWNLTELAGQARAAAPTSPFTQQAYDDIVAENGGTPEQKPDEYSFRTVVNRAADIAASGIKGIVLVHAVDDGEASYDQAQQMEKAMRNAGVATDLYSVSRKADGDTPDTTLDGNRDHGGPRTRVVHAPHLDGHRLRRPLRARPETGPPPCNRDFSTDGQANPHTTPDPNTAAAGCPAKPHVLGPRRAPERQRQGARGLQRRAGPDAVLEGHHQKSTASRCAGPPRTAAAPA